MYPSAIDHLQILANQVSKFRQIHEPKISWNAFKLMLQLAFCWIEVERKRKAKINWNYIIIMMIPGCHSLCINIWSVNELPQIQAKNHTVFWLYKNLHEFNVFLSVVQYLALFLRVSMRLSSFCFVVVPLIHLGIIWILGQMQMMVMISTYIEAKFDFWPMSIFDCGERQNKWHFTCSSSFGVGNLFKSVIRLILISSHFLFFFSRKWQNLNAFVFTSYWNLSLNTRCRFDSFRFEWCIIRFDRISFMMNGQLTSKEKVTKKIIQTEQRT